MVTGFFKYHYYIVNIYPTLEDCVIMVYNRYIYFNYILFRF